MQYRGTQRVPQVVVRTVLHIVIATLTLDVGRLTRSDMDLTGLNVLPEPLNPAPPDSSQADTIPSPLDTPPPQNSESLEDSPPPSVNFTGVSPPPPPPITFAGLNLLLPSSQAGIEC